MAVWVGKDDEIQLFYTYQVLNSQPTAKRIQYKIFESIEAITLGGLGKTRWMGASITSVSLKPLVVCEAELDG